MASLKIKTLNLVVNLLKRTIGLAGKKGNSILAELAGQLAPVVSVQTPRGSIQFFCPDRILVWRAETLLSKEPETIEWIDSFEEGAVFWDIGANVGVYSLYAALNSSRNVLSFEPAAANYYILNKNIEINRMADRIRSFCLAFNDTTCLDHLHMNQTHPGSALHSFTGEKAIEGQQAPPPFFQQGMVGFQIDQFIETFNPAFPNHIKIDVDGNEDKIIEGAQKTLSDPRVRSILIELDTQQKDLHQKVSMLIEGTGMKLASQKHSASVAEGPYASIYNHIFKRE